MVVNKDTVADCLSVSPENHASVSSTTEPNPHSYSRISPGTDVQTSSPHIPLPQKTRSSPRLPVPAASSGLELRCVSYRLPPCGWYEVLLPSPLQKPDNLPVILFWNCFYIQSDGLLLQVWAVQTTVLYFQMSESFLPEGASAHCRNEKLHPCCV